jgi:hypothetical protein
MKLELQVAAPFPEMLRQFAPEGVVVEYPPFSEKREGLQDINWVAMTISWAGSALTPVVVAFVAKYAKRVHAKIRTEHGYEEFTPEVVGRMLANAKEVPNKSPEATPGQRPPAPPSPFSGAPQL